MNIKTNWILSPKNISNKLGEFPKYKFENGIHLYQDKCYAIPKFQALSSNNYKKKAEKMFRNIVQEQGYPDIIHAHITYPGGYIGTELSEVYDIPLVVTEHASYFSDQLLSGMYKRYSEKVLKKAHRYTAVSSQLAKIIKSTGREECTVIPNFININDFVVNENIINSDFLFVNIAAMRHIKGIDILLKAIEILVFKFNKKNFKVDFIGGGSELQKYINMAIDLGVIKWCDFHGNIVHSEIPSILEKSNALIISSRFETFGISGIEAMACGKPVLSTNCGGPSDYINENTGIILKGNSPEELAMEMLSFINQDKRWDPYTIREYVELNYSSSSVSKKILNLYNETVINNN
ncbi:glycosyltransferase [Rossellomorea marisflavi]|uniref:glycosyltransferase n=1 Tax=Rossellomorea marisflavi TaxID=189381 RepID=UPI002799F431|nr:glycosyltransferase [Rossellomorea marisflavi]UTE73409.1 glycosyltransferase [Rossellomorea marisflavi]